MVNVIGLGYIGLPTALMMASHGVEVVGTNHGEEKVKTLKAGNITFEEKGLDELFQKALQSGIRFTTEYQTADYYIISVATPYDEATKKVDMSIVMAALEDVVRVAPADATVIIESTVSPGSIDKHVRPFLKEKSREDLHIVHAPERIIPGNMVYELLHNDRTIGADDPEIGEKVKKLYASFCQGDIVITDIKTAEMTKVIENTFRCVNIAFANELAKICAAEGIDVYEVIRICNKHPRVNILQPGPGVGGHCIPVDPWFLVGDHPELTKLIRDSLEVNQSMPLYVLAKIKEICEKENISFDRVGLYGLAFKENVDDYRQSPTLQLLKQQPFKVYDPWISCKAAENQYYDFNEFLAAADLVVIMVGHSQLREQMDKLQGKIILDTRKICDLPGVYRL